MSRVFFGVYFFWLTTGTALLFGSLTVDLLPALGEARLILPLLPGIAVLVGVWSGWKGGPLLVTRSLVLFHLGAAETSWPLMRHSLSQLVIQSTVGWFVGVFIGAGAALAALAAGTYVAATVAIGFGTALLVSGMKSKKSTLAQKRRSAVGVLGVGAATLLLAGQYPVWEAQREVVAASVAITVFAMAAGLWSVRFQERPALWERSEAMDSVLTSVYFMDPAGFVSGLRLVGGEALRTRARSFMPDALPAPIARQVASWARLPLPALLRLFVLLAGVVTVAAFTGGAVGSVGVIVLPALAFIVGLDLFGAFSVENKTPLWRRHYVPSAIPAHLSFLLVPVLVLLTAVAAGSILHSFPEITISAALISGAVAIGVLAAAVQASMGPPDVAALIGLFGFGGVGIALGLRGVIPLLLPVGAASAVVRAPAAIDPVTIWTMALLGAFSALLVARHARQRVVKA